MDDGGVVLIQRKNPPYGWAIPGGFVDYGETLEQAVVRETKEETSLDYEHICQFHCYSDPKRDERSHTISTVFIGKGRGIPKADDDARELGIFTEKTLPAPIAFDHSRILHDYFHFKKTGKYPCE
jgi:8-oxo-dGTP diphosphatase